MTKKSPLNLLFKGDFAVNATKMNSVDVDVDYGCYGASSLV
jgi:hypothetical protein